MTSNRSPLASRVMRLLVDAGLVLPSLVLMCLLGTAPMADFGTFAALVMPLFAVGLGGAALLGRAKYSRVCPRSITHIMALSLVVSSAALALFLVLEIMGAMRLAALFALSYGALSVVTWLGLDWVIAKWMVPTSTDVTPILDATPRRSLPPLSATARCCYNGKVVMITGAGGSIGSELARQTLNQRPARLVLLEWNEFALYKLESTLRPLAEEADIPIAAVLGSVGDRRSVERVLSDNAVEIVLHAAAYKQVPLVEANAVVALDNNVLGTECLALAAAEAGVERFIFISTDKAVRPKSIMGLSKWVAEHVVRDISRRYPNMDTAIVRFGNVLGSSGSVLPVFEDQVRRGGPVTVTDPRMKRFFMSVEEAVHLVLETGAMIKPDTRDHVVYFFDMGEPIFIEALARRVIQRAGHTVKDAARPDGDIELQFTGARAGEKLSEELAVSSDITPTTHPRIFSAAEDVVPPYALAQIMGQVRMSVETGETLHPDTIVSTAVGVDSRACSSAFG